MERLNRHDRSRDPGSDAGSTTTSNSTTASTRLRSRRIRDTRSSAVEDSASEDVDTDASSGSHTPDASTRRPRRLNASRQMTDETRRSSSCHSDVDRRSLRSGDEEDGGRAAMDEEEMEIGEEERESEDELEEEMKDEEKYGRSMSIVSATSSTSTFLEPMTEDQRRERLDRQVAELEQKKKMVEDGTLAEFCRRVAAFKEERNRLLQTAELHKNLQLKNGQDLYHFEVQRAHHLWQNDRKVLKEELLTKVDAILLKIQREIKVLSELGAAGVETRRTSRLKRDVRHTFTEKLVRVTEDRNALESKMAKDSEQEEGEVIEQLLPCATKEVVLAKRRKMDPTTTADPVDVSQLLAVEVVRLPFDDVSSDIAAVVGDWKKMAQSMVACSPSMGKQPFKLERRRLCCGNYIFEDGDEVHVSMPLVQEDCMGTISSITDTAIYIKLASGQKARIFLPHLERRRCELKPLLRAKPLTGSLHSMGWSEYDTFY
uniref:Uncharacterized protein n=1 Tax=Hyaloperonospora arabidopsidis (strain Emoy2) TaxID=559515 RepID=M4BKJ1_HYAAE